VLVVGGHEDHERHSVGANRLDDVEAIHLWHLHVEEHQIGRVILNRGDGLFAIAALGHDLDVGFAPEQRRQPLPGKRLVVDDERPDLLHIRPLLFRPGVGRRILRNR
jgi:hypothetical protein